MNILDPYGYMIPEIFPVGEEPVPVDPYCPEYRVVYDSFITKPPDDIAEEHDQMVLGMIADGDWQTKDVFYVTSAQSPMDSLINLSLIHI